MSAGYRTDRPLGTSPTCAAIGGCVGLTFCSYCGEPQPVRTEARQRLADAIAVLRAQGVQA